MSQLPKSASFHERVADFFCFLRGHGAALSPLDLELLELWALAQVPFEVVARGIRRSFEARLTGLKQDQNLSLPSLRSCRRHVESEMARFLRLHLKTAAPVEATEATEAEAAKPYAHTKHLRLRKQLRNFAKQHPWAYTTVASLLLRLQKPDDIELAMRQEMLAILMLVRALPAQEKKKLLEETRKLVKTREAFSREAAQEQWRFFLAFAFKQRFGIRNWG